MALPAGGDGDKRGNAYETDFGVRLMLDVLLGDRPFVQPEPASKALEVVDFTSELGGASEHYQCKARAPDGTWTWKRLGSILSRMLDILRSDDHARCYLITQSPADGLDSLTLDAEQSLLTAEEFYARVTEAGSKRKSHYEQFCKTTGLDADSPDDAIAAQQLLTRISVGPYNDRLPVLDHHGSMRLIFDTTESEIASIVASLRQLTVGQRGVRLSEETLRTLLEEQGFRFREDVPRTVVEQIRQCRDSFLERTNQELIAGNLTTINLRPDLVEHFRDTNQHTVVTGAKGIGKTVLVADAIGSLTRAGFLVLPISLDDISLGESARELSDQLGFRGSVVACLRAARKASANPNFPAVLVLDQLDAIRWTTQHARSAVRVIEQILEEVDAAGTGQIRLVTACRKFDLETDASIKRTLSRLAYREFHVENLSRKAVLESCNQVGRVPSNEKQIELLSTPIHLSHWHEIVASQSSEQPLAFSTPLQLFQQVWEVRRKAVEQELGPQIAIERDEILSDIRRHLEGRGRLAAPRLLLGRNEALAHAMQAHGLVAPINTHQIKFPHQTDLEYLIAEAAADELTRSGGRVAGWLGNRSAQTLFLREPLRLLLEMIITEHGGDPRPFVEDLLQSNEVRHHIKLTAIAALRELGGTPQWLSFVAELATDDRWSNTALSMVVRLRPDVTEALLKSHAYAALLADKAPSNQAALCLLSTIRDHPDVAATIFDQDDHFGLDDDLVRQIIFDVDVVRCSESLFARRLELIRSGISRDYYDWGTLSNRSPQRAVRLVAAHYEKAIREQRETGQSVHLKLDMDRLFDDGILNDTAKKIAGANAWLVWQTLFPILKQHQRYVREERGGRTGHWIDHTVPKEISTLLIEAGRHLATAEAEELFARFRLMIRSDYRAIFRVILGSLEDLPANHADAGIELLLSEEAFFWCGERETETGPEPAAAVIRKLSDYCGSEILCRLEDRLCSYNAPWELDVYRSRMKRAPSDRSVGFAGDYLGKSKHQLLGAIDSSRTSMRTTSVLGCLERKFPNAERTESKSTDSEVSAGWVEPSISLDAALRMTDRQWTRLVKSGVQPNKNSYAGNFKESSPQAFSTRLFDAGCRDPRRFARLAMTWPLREINHHYTEAILKIVSLDHDDRSIHRSDHSGPPAPSDEVREIMRATKPSQRVDGEVYRGDLRNWFSVLEYRIDLHWPEDVIAELRLHAGDISPDATDTSFFGQHDEFNAAHQLLEVALNSVRGQVCSAVGGVFRSQQPNFDLLVPTLKQLLRDTHPGVIMMAIEAARPCIADGNEDIIDAVADAIVNEPIAGAAYNAPDLIWWLGNNHSELAVKCLVAMLQSDSAEAQKEAAELVAFNTLVRDQLLHMLDSCLAGTVPMRAGVGEAIKQIVESAGSENKYEIESLCQTVWNDDDADVRLAATPHWRNVRLDEVDPSILQVYVDSATFRDHAGRFIYRLKDADAQRHEATILNVCRQFITHRAEIEIEPGSAEYHVISELVPLLLRLYESTSVANQDQILDAFDDLFESETVPAFGLLHRLEERF